MADVLREALQIIADWKLPETGEFYDAEKKHPRSFTAEHGFLGAQDYMRGIARTALEATAQQAAPTDKMVECSICEGDPDRCDIHDCGDAHNLVNPYRNADEGLYGPEYQGQQAEVTFHDVLKLAQQIRQSLTEFIERHP